MIYLKNFVAVVTRTTWEYNALILSIQAQELPMIQIYFNQGCSIKLKQNIANIV